MYPNTPLTKEELEKLPTKRILAYKRKYFSDEKNNWDDNIDNCPCDVCRTERWVAHQQYLKSYYMIKDILRTREHVE